MSEPRFPPEIEEIIFVYALQTNPRHPTNLSLVAKRVYEWLLPIAYNVVVTHFDREFLDTDCVECKPLFPIQHGAHINHFLVSFPTQYAGDECYPGPDDGYPLLDEPLFFCPNITNLAIWWYEPPLLRLSSLTSLTSLTHLSMDVNRLLELIRGERDIDFSGQTEPRNWFGICQAANSKQALFPSVTHFDAMEADWLASRARDNIEALAHHFPGLTHVAYAHTGWTSSNPAVLRLSLEKLMKLQVLVWGKRAQGDDVELGLVDERLRVDDERLLVLVTDRERDWEREARGTGFGIWTFADRTMERKRKESLGLGLGLDTDT